MMCLGQVTTGLMVSMNMVTNTDQYWLITLEKKLNIAILCNLSFCYILWEEVLDQVWAVTS